jgi:hypothetical protein
MLVSTTVHVSGPFFDGRTGNAINGAVKDMEREVAQWGYNMVHARLRRVLKHPTGYYQSFIQTERKVDSTEINDGWPTSGTPVYGPWLEGTGSRNFPETRFKGYRTFRLVAQRMNAQVGPKADRILRQRLVGMK